MKNLLKMSDLSPAELTHILDVADQLKAQQKLGGTAPLLAGKTVALMFSKASTRTRTSFEVGVYQLGGLGNYMNTAELQAGRGEPLKDTARVLGRYYDCVVWRDQLVPFNQSCRLYATLKALGKDVTFYKLDNACHACYGFRSARALRLVFDWLSDRL